MQCDTHIAKNPKVFHDIDNTFNSQLNENRYAVMPNSKRIIRINNVHSIIRKEHIMKEFIHALRA